MAMSRILQALAGISWAQAAFLEAVHLCLTSLCILPVTAGAVLSFVHAVIYLGKRLCEWRAHDPRFL